MKTALLFAAVCSAFFVLTRGVIIPHLNLINDPNYIFFFRRTREIQGPSEGCLTLWLCKNDREELIRERRKF